MLLSQFLLYIDIISRLSLQTVRRDRSEIISADRRYEKRITIPRRATQTANRKVPGNIRRSVSAETSIPRIEYGPDGEHQRQYDRGYPPSWIETAPPRDGNRKNDGSRIRKSIMQDRRHNGIYPLYEFRMWQRRYAPRSYHPDATSPWKVNLGIYILENCPEVHKVKMLLYLRNNIPRAIHLLRWQQRTVHCIPNFATYFKHNAIIENV